MKYITDTWLGYLSCAHTYMLSYYHTREKLEKIFKGFHWCPHHINHVLWITKLKFAHYYLYKFHDCDSQSTRSLFYVSTPKETEDTGVFLPHIGKTI